MTGMPTKMMMGRNRIRATGGPGEGGCLGEGGGGLVQNAVSLSGCCAAGPWRPVLGGSSPGLSPQAGGRAWGVSPAPSPAAAQQCKRHSITRVANRALPVPSLPSLSLLPLRHRAEPEPGLGRSGATLPLGCPSSSVPCGPSLHLLLPPRYLKIAP